MVAAMGFAKALDKANLLSNISGLSTSSGGSWFALQFLHSESFYQRLLHDDSVHDLVTTWMEAYERYTASVYEKHIMCKFFRRRNEVETFCNLLLSVDGSWATLVEGMLHAASSAYGDANLTTRVVRAENRVADLANMDLYIQMSLAANSRSDGNNTISYLRPTFSSSNQSHPAVYTVPIPVQHVLTTNSSYFAYAVEPDRLPLQTAVAPAPGHFSIDSWKDFCLYPVRTRGSLLTVVKSPVTKPNGPLREPFSGKPTVAQLAASSSAAAGILNGDVPSLLAQVGSVERNEIMLDNATSFVQRKEQVLQLEVELDMIYRHAVFDGFAVCTQWPLACGESDGRLIDGGFVDDTGLAQNVGHYQQQQGGDLNATLKLIVTNMNEKDDPSVSLLQYFRTSWNRNVAPGDFLFTNEDANPHRSTQIFADFMDADAFTAAFAPIEGTTLTWASFHTTTVNNPAFGVREGQRVNVLIIQLNSDISTLIVGTDSIRENTKPLADMASEIANSQHLVTVLDNFLASSDLRSFQQSKNVAW